MKKVALIVLFSAVTASAFFPRMSFGQRGDSRNIDENFMRDDNRSIVIDQKNKKMYSDTQPSQRVTFGAAERYCQKMTFQTYTDWRVPTKNELRSLLNNRRRDVTIKHAFKNVKDSIYWSSTLARHHKGWYFDFDLGRYGKRDVKKRFHVFCVRDIRR